MALLLAFAGVACGSDSDHGAHSGDNQQPAEVMEHEGSVPGAAAEPSEADRKVPVIASDDQKFTPTSIEVSAGDVITFLVRNDGETDHEFVLGDEAYQAMHEEDMAQGDGHMMGTDNAVTVGPGETEEITWRFSEAGEVLYGCHQPGHYDDGMVGTIEVSSS